VLRSIRRNTLLPALLGWATVSGYDADLPACFYPDNWPIFSSALTVGTDCGPGRERRRCVAYGRSLGQAPVSSTRPESNCGMARSVFRTRLHPERTIAATAYDGTRRRVLSWTGSPAGSVGPWCPSFTVARSVLLYPKVFGRESSNGPARCTCSFLVFPWPALP